MKANIENSIKNRLDKDDNKLNIDKRKQGNSNRGTKIRTTSSIIAIIIGILLILYPKFKNIYEDYQQKLLIKNWQESFLIIDDNGYGSSSDNNISIESLKDKGIDVEAEGLEDIDRFQNEEIGEENNSNQVIYDDYIKNNMVGMLIIEKIDLNLPILNKTTKDNLSKALTTIEPERKPGQIGNLAIAGHRSHAYGKNFNRLNEIIEGDVIQVNDGKETYTYTVTEIIIVKPEDIWVLDGDGESKEITLVTCHPLKNPTHRLIIKGKIKE